MEGDNIHIVSQLQKVGYCMTYEPEDEFGPGGYYYDYPGRYPGPPEWLREQDY